MREAAFLRQNADKWKQFERLLADRSADADRLAELFAEVTDDLSYAKTFYPGGKTTRYLNELAREVHQQIYKNRREEGSRFVRFWREEVPLAAYEARRELLAALLIFVVAAAIGVVSASNDQSFARLVLGDAYVNMTMANIEEGDPMAVYKDEAALSMFLGITFNNVRVSFTAFAAGLLLSVGTAVVLFVNGVMLGTFHTLFYQQGFLWTSLLVVYIHGAIEISAIVVAGGAGLAMGNGILFPGTYARSVSFRRGARRGMKLVVGLVPLFVAAGFLESFVTRYTEMPLALSLSIILGSLAFMGWYFGLYPHRVARSARAAAREATAHQGYEPAGFSDRGTDRAADR